MPPAPASVLRSLGTCQAPRLPIPIPCRGPLRFQYTFRHGPRAWVAPSVARGHQIRQQSGSLENRPRVSAFQFFFGNVFNAFRAQGVRAAFNSNPAEFVLAMVVLFASAGLGTYAVVSVTKHFYAEKFNRYPKPVAKSLRRAVYYGDYGLNPDLALKYYKLALEQCDELRLDHFSDEVLGIKIRFAQWLEKIENYDNAILVLETVLADCKRWVEAMEASVRGRPNDAGPAPDGQQASDAQEEARNLQYLWAKRNRILRKAIGISVKLGALYSDDHVLRTNLAHERLLWGVETILKELQRRTVEGVKDGEGEWMTSEAIGGTLEALGHSYEKRSQFDLAAPLFLQALRLCQDPCHSAVLMNNIAASFAQHPVQPPAGSVEESPGTASVQTVELPPATTRKELLETAQRWAQNARRHAVETEGEARTPECDEACIVSLCNLGDIASSLGDFREARRQFREARDMSKKFDFADGLRQAEAGLRRLAETP